MARIPDTPLSDTDLWNYIWHGCGGIKRSKDYWDSHISSRENSDRYAHLDRAHGEGRPIDSLADEIGAVYPWYGITDANSLWDWLGRYPTSRGVAA